jgi:hypothetical protein
VSVRDRIRFRYAMASESMRYRLRSPGGARRPMRERLQYQRWRAQAAGDSARDHAWRLRTGPRRLGQRLPYLRLRLQEAAPSGRRVAIAAAGVVAVAVATAGALGAFSTGSGETSVAALPSSGVGHVAAVDTAAEREAKANASARAKARAAHHARERRADARRARAAKRRRAAAARRRRAPAPAAPAVERVANTQPKTTSPAPTGQAAPQQPVSRPAPARPAPQAAPKPQPKPAPTGVSFDDEG